MNNYKYTFHFLHSTNIKTSNTQSKFIIFTTLHQFIVYKFFNEISIAIKLYNYNKFTKLVQTLIVENYEDISLKFYRCFRDTF